MKKSKNLSGALNAENEVALSPEPSPPAQNNTHVRSLPEQSSKTELTGNGGLPSGGRHLRLGVTAGETASPKPKRRLERNAEHQVYKLRDGSIVAGCSTICKLGESSEGLIRWANAMGLKGIDSTKFRDKSADLGHLSHFQISCFMDNVEPDMREYSDEDIAKSRFGFEKFLDFWTKERLTVVASEKQMVSELHRYGGTLDIVARDEDGLLVLLDGKSARKAVYFGMKAQLGGYESLWNQNNEEQISRRAILRIPPVEGGEFQAHWYPEKKAKKYVAIFHAQAKLYTTIRDYDKLHN